MEHRTLLNLVAYNAETLKHIKKYGRFHPARAGLEVASTGYNPRIAEERGFKVLTGRTKMKNKPSYMPDAGTGRLLGGQVTGEEGAAWRARISPCAG